jgi:hypothetical protein
VVTNGRSNSRNAVTFSPVRTTRDQKYTFSFHISRRLSGDETYGLVTRRQNVACHSAGFCGRLRSIKTMKKLIWLLPLLTILGAMVVAVETKGSSPTHEITISYGNLVDSSGRSHSVQLVLHPDGSVTWRDLTRHLR